MNGNQIGLQGMHQSNSLRCPTIDNKVRKRFDVGTLYISFGTVEIVLGGIVRQLQKKLVWNCNQKGFKD